MKEGLKLGLSVGAFLTITTYVAGFIWQYAYLGSITDDIQWIKIVTTDYVHIGIMAMVVSLSVIDVFIYFVFLCLIAAGVCFFKSLVLSAREGLNDKWRNRFDRMIRFSFLSSATSFNENKVIVFFAVLLLWSTLFVSVLLSATEAMAQRLTSDGVDKVCHKDEGCYEGKVLYVGDKQIYFYSFDDKEKVMDGMLKLVSVSNWTVTMAWDERGRNLINHYLDGDD